MSNLKEFIKDHPQLKEAYLLRLISLYRELHNRAKGRPCTCGVCRMVQKDLVEGLGFDFTVQPRNFTNNDPETFFRILEVAGDDDAEQLTEEEVIRRVKGVSC